MDVAFQTGLICRHFRGRESCQCGCREHNSHARMQQRSPALSPPCFVAGTASLTGDDPSLCLPPREEGGKAPSDKLSPGTAAWAEPRLTAPAVPGAWALQCTPESALQSRAAPSTICARRGQHRLSRGACAPQGTQLCRPQARDGSIQELLCDTGAGNGCSAKLRGVGEGKTLICSRFIL